MVVEHAQHKSQRQRPMHEDRLVSVLGSRIAGVDMDGVRVEGECREVEEMGRRGDDGDGVCRGVRVYKQSFSISFSSFKSFQSSS